MTAGHQEETKMETSMLISPRNNGNGGDLHNWLTRSCMRVYPRQYPLTDT